MNSFGSQLAQLAQSLVALAENFPAVKLLDLALVCERQLGLVANSCHAPPLERHSLVSAGALFANFSALGPLFPTTSLNDITKVCSHLNTSHQGNLFQHLSPDTDPRFVCNVYTAAALALVRSLLYSLQAPSSVSADPPSFLRLAHAAASSVAGMGKSICSAEGQSGPLSTLEAHPDPGAAADRAGLQLVSTLLQLSIEQGLGASPTGVFLSMALGVSDWRGSQNGAQQIPPLQADKALEARCHA